MEPNERVSLPEIAKHVLDDLRWFLAGIEPVLYQAQPEVLSGSTIGQHTRHIIEFFQCLLEQCDNGSLPVINYAQRRRDYLIESAPDHALSKVNELSDRLTSLQTEKQCLLDSTEHGEQSILVPSTIARELIYTIEHAIHHLAIVKIALKIISPQFPLPEHFGVAPSTIRYRQESCAQ
jgi:uncharacterized damage-inducible protein DinB